MSDINFTAFNLSPHVAYNQSMSDGSSQTLEGVDLGEGTYGYCLENEMTSTMLGDLKDSTFLSREACQERLGQAKSGELSPSLFEAWNLDAPEATNGNLDAREEARQTSIPAIDSLKPAASKRATEEKHASSKPEVSESGKK